MRWGRWDSGQEEAGLGLVNPEEQGIGAAGDRLTRDKLYLETL